MEILDDGYNENCLLHYVTLTIFFHRAHSSHVSTKIKRPRVFYEYTGCHLSSGRRGLTFAARGRVQLLFVWKKTSIQREMLRAEMNCSANAGVTGGFLRLTSSPFPFLFFFFLSSEYKSRGIFVLSIDRGFLCISEKFRRANVQRMRVYTQSYIKYAKFNAYYNV